MKVHALVLELTAKREPNAGIEGNFSVFQSCAAAISLGGAAQVEKLPALCWALGS